MPTRRPITLLALLTAAGCATYTVTTTPTRAGTAVISDQRLRTLSAIVTSYEAPALTRVARRQSAGALGHIRSAGSSGPVEQGLNGGPTTDRENAKTLATPKVPADGWCNWRLYAMPAKGLMLWIRCDHPARKNRSTRGACSS